MLPENQIVKSFKGQDIQFIEHNGELWLTAEKIGSALGYGEPRKSILKIAERNTEEFEGLTTVVKMTTEAGMRETTIFSRDAVNLICMFSKQPMAKVFRKWVLQVLREIQTSGQYSLFTQLDMPKPMSVQEIRLENFFRQFTQKIENKIKDFYQDEIVKAEERAMNKIVDFAEGILQIDNAPITLEKPEIVIPEDKIERLVELRRFVQKNFRVGRFENRANSLIEIAEAVNEFYILMGRSTSKAAESLGVSKTYVTDVRGFLRAAPEVLRLVRERQIDSYDVLKNITKAPLNIQEELAIEVVGMVPKNAVRLIAKYITRGKAA